MKIDDNTYLVITCNYIMKKCEDYKHPELGKEIVDMLEDVLRYVDVVNKENNTLGESVRNE